MRTRYRIVLSKLAESKFNQIIRADRTHGQQIAKAIDRLASHPEIGRFLTGEWKDYRRYRTGNYRIIYRVEHGRLIVYVMTIAHRKEVYR